MLIRSILGVEHSLARVAFNLRIPVVERVHMLVATHDTSEDTAAAIAVNPVSALGHMGLAVGLVIE